MITLRVSCVSALLATAAPAGAATSDVPTVDQLVGRHVAARGGLDALRRIRTLKMTGTMRPGGFDAELAFNETIVRPGAVRIDATLQGLTLVQAYDGASGWQIQPFQGRKDPEGLPPDDTKSLQEEADFEGALIDAKAKGAVLESLGSRDVDGAPAWAVRATLRNGDQETYYLDPDAMLTVRVVTRQLVRGAEVLTQTDYGDYEKVDGVYFPFEVASGPRGGTSPQRVTYASIAANVPVDPSTFARPGTASPATSPAAPASAPSKPGALPVPGPANPAMITPQSKPAGTPPPASGKPSGPPR